MHTVPVQRLPIIAETALEERLIRDIQHLGARGYTITRATGAGSCGVRASEWEGQNIKLETLVGAEAAERILEHLATQYFEHYAVVAYIETVNVVRREKYV
jgi:hypothetical protein